MSSSNEDSDEGGYDVSIFEKKMYMIMIPHTLFWTVQTNTEQADFSFECQRNLIASCCLYLCESNVVKQ